MYPILVIMNKIDFTYLENLQDILDRIEYKKGSVDARRPLSSQVLARLKNDLALEWTYHSNAIEGNSLTLVETRIVLEEGMTIGGKSLREHFETINHAKAIDYVEDLVSEDVDIRPVDLLKLHEIVMAGMDDHYAGRIRDMGVRIMGANFTPPSPLKVSDLLEEMIDYISDNPDGISVPVIAAVFHHRFVWIHPFTDGNGRTARLAMNLFLQRLGYPPCIILKNDRKKYYAALNQANNGNYEKITMMVLQGIERSLNLYMNIIPKSYAEYKPISDIVAEDAVPYGMEYISLLARRGKINAHKEGRNWVTTEADVLAYAKRHGK